MKKWHVIQLFVFIAVAGNAVGQQDSSKVSVYAEEDLYEDDPYFWSNTKEIGINITPLLSRFVPFNLGDKQPGALGFQWKRYYAKRAFRFGLGANVTGFDQNDGNNFLFLSFGLEKRHPISKDKKLTYSSAWDVVLQVSENEDEFLAGIAKGYGIEYHFTKRIFAGTQAQMILGSGANGPHIEFRLPTDIFIHVRLY
jgi:hypothetical protein